MSDLDEISKEVSHTPRWKRRGGPTSEPVNSLVPILWILCILACAAISWWLIKEYRQAQAQREIIEAIEAAKRSHEEKFRSEREAVAELERQKLEAEREEKRRRDSKIFGNP